MARRVLDMGSLSVPFHINCLKYGGRISCAGKARYGARNMEAASDAVFIW